MSPEFEAEQKAIELERKLEAAERKLAAEQGAKATVTRLRRELAEKDRLIDTLTAIDQIEVSRPNWAPPKRHRSDHVAVVNLMLSDLHLDEVVDPNEMGGLNAYDRDIAKRRLHRTFERAIVLARDYMQGLTFDGFSLALGGDLFSGWIHEELAETNAGRGILDSVDYWVDHLAAGIDMLLTEFGHGSVVSVVGNHGRLHRKPRAKQGVHQNIDWLLARLLSREFRSEDRLAFNIPDSLEVHYQIYDTTYRLEHGNNLARSGGSGIAGLFSPLMLGRSRSALNALATGEHFDVLLVGHWHQYVPVPGKFLVNGSLKGWDEYARMSKFAYEPPAQAWWLTTPEHGMSFNAPILPAQRSKEGW